MGFVEQDQAVVANQTGMDGPHSSTGTISTEQQARAELIDSAGDDHGLGGRLGPGFGANHATTQLVCRQRDVSVGKPAQTVGDFLDDAVLRVTQFAGQGTGTLVGLVHDHPPVHHEEDAPGSGEGLPFHQSPRLRRQGIDGDVHTGRLARRRGQGDGLGPGRGSVLDDSTRQFPLPGKRRFPPKRLEERHKTGCVEFTHGLLLPGVAGGTGHSPGTARRQPAPGLAPLRRTRSRHGRGACARHPSCA